MYNTKGGKILIGADDSGKLIGLDSTDFKLREEKEYKNFFNDKVSKWINPNIPKSLDILKSSGLTFLLITVNQIPQSKLQQSKPFECFKFDNGPERPYI